MTFVSRIDDLRLMAVGYGADVAELARHVLDDARFARWSGSIKNRHHYGEGGLQYHTWEVVTLCRDMAAFAKREGHAVDERVLFLAAVWHDVSKTDDYEEGPSGCEQVEETNIAEARGLPVPIHWRSAPHHRLIHHVSGSARHWTRAVAKTGLCTDIEDKVLHCILSHHAAYGSPIMPKTREAWILHLSDALSARIDDCDRLDLRS